jgi:Peptidase of plants and bacteria
MKRLLWAVLVLLCGPAGASCGAKPAAEPARPAPRFEADTSRTPELQPWGRAAEALCQAWYPRIVAILKSDDSVRPLPPVVRLVFEPDMKGVAHATGDSIHIAAAWVNAHPHDFGMVIHELTHLVQRYPSYQAGWLVEGIADYIRLAHFEPALPRPKIDFTKAKHTDSYKTTAVFLIWLEEKYDRNLIPRLNAALRAGSYSDALFQAITGKEVGQLWSEFAAAQGTTKAQ